MSTTRGLLEDPFPQVQQEVRSTWVELERTRSQLSEKERTERLAQIQEDVRDLRRALNIAKMDPKRYNISENDIRTRTTFLSDMQTSISNFNPSSASPSSMPSQDEYINNELKQQQVEIEMQDEHLDDLANAVERIGNLGRDMHSELEQQGDMLEDLNGRFDGTLHRLKAITQRVDLVIQQTGRKQFCTIVWLVVTFFILTILIIAT